MSTATEFEAWRQHKLSELTREMDALATEHQTLQAQVFPARHVGPAGEEVARALGEFLQCNGCVEGTLELTRRVTPDSAQCEGILYGTGTRGQLESFFNFRFEPFMARGEAILQEHEGDGLLIVRVDLSRRSSEVKLLERPELHRKWWVERLEADLSALERKRTWFRDMALSTKPFGLELARRVARRLRKESLNYSHRDYCGMGLFCKKDGGFVYTSVYDGYPQDVARRFQDEEELSQWLAEQSDLSLSNFGTDFGFLNQTLNRELLEAFVA